MPQILHVSDVHFGPPHRERCSRALLDLVAAKRPDLFVVAGDLTQRAKPVQFQQAKAFVEASAVPTLAVPGNHDVPMYRVWERLFAPFGAYRNHFAQEMEPSFRSDDLTVVGVNSAFNWTIKDGRIRGSQRRRMVGEFERSAPNACRVAVIHHELIPPPRFGSRKVLTGAEETVGALRKAQVEVVLSGHLHQSFVGTTEQYYPSGEDPILILHSGTTTSTRGRGCERGKSTGFWLNIQASRFVVTRLLWDEEAGSFQQVERSVFPRWRRGRSTVQEADSS